MYGVNLPGSAYYPASYNHRLSPENEDTPMFEESFEHDDYEPLECCDAETIQRLVLPAGIATEEDANLVGAELAKIRNRRERAKQRIEREKKLIAQFDCEEARLLDRYGADFKAFAAERLAGTKRRSLELLDVTLGYRKAPDKLEVTDESAVIQWARRHMPDAVKVVESVLKTPIKDAVKRGLEVPPGCEYKAGGDEFFIK